VFDYENHRIYGMERIDMNIRQQRVIALCFLLLVFAVSGFAEEPPQFYAGSLDGTTGLFKTWDAENLKRGKFNISFGYDQFNRDPGLWTIGRGVVGGAVGIVDRLEVFGAIDARRVASDLDHPFALFYPNSGRYVPRIFERSTYAFPSQEGESFRDENGNVSASKILSKAVGSVARGDILLGTRFNVLSERKGKPLSFSVALFGKISEIGEDGRLQSDFRKLSKNLKLKNETDITKQFTTNDAGGYLLFSKTTSDNIRLHANVGGTYKGIDDSDNGEFEFN